MKTIEDCFKEVAIKHKVGQYGLVIGHSPKYFK